MGHFMNKQYGRHMMETATEAKPEPAGEQFKGEEQAGQAQTSEHPHIFVHSHAAGHTVHVHHKSKDGEKPKHDEFEHELGDKDVVAERIRQALSGEPAEHETAAEEQAEQI